MTSIRLIAGAMLATPFLVPQAALADLSVADAWAEIVAQSEAMGQSLTAGSETAGDGELVLTDVTVAYEIEGMSATGTIPEVRLVETDDGAVRMTMSDSFDMEAIQTISPAYAPSFDLAMDMTIGLPGAETLISEEGDMVTTEFTAPTMTTSMTSSRPDDEEEDADATAQEDATDAPQRDDSGEEGATGDDMSGDDTAGDDTAGDDMAGADELDPYLSDEFDPMAGYSQDLEFEMTDVSGSYTTPRLREEGAEGALDGKMQIGALTFTSVSESELMPGPATLEMTAEDSEVVFSGPMAQFGSAQNMAAMIAGDGVLKLNYTLSNGTTNYEMSGGGTRIDSTFDAATLAFQAGGGNMDYDTNVSGLSIRGDAPVPDAGEITVDVADATFGASLDLPEEGETTGPVSYDVSVSGVEGNPMAFAMMGVPALTDAVEDPSLSFEVAGTTMMATDVMLELMEADMDEEPQQPMGEPPFEVGTTTIDTLKLSFGGAELTGSGEFESREGAVPGTPPVTGQADIVITGLQGLLGKLTDAGVIDGNQAGFVTMMTGMFATPAGDDRLESEIVIDEDGAVTANGQRIQ
ncbi:DUF2125 domain-containing protein [Mesobaculum littorinae]|uniref:DUF2125 domain-containing protein n=1 Tax=Mesobaculum littorinae TaxID=2486419 RepID=A0A438AHJ1_9RHOB|nr:DUF2125 domain-containing protein [Mesobaculum littorinae]RVV98057.1 DUF2125 domain-containing protein [Mesobaculum littorinae]